MGTPADANVPEWIDGQIEIDISGDNDFVVSTTLKAANGSNCEVVQYSVSGGDSRYEDLQMPCGNDFTSVTGTNQTQIDVQALYTIGETADFWPLAKAAQGGAVAIRLKPDGTTAYGHTITGKLLDVGFPTPQSGRYVYSLSIRGAQTYGAIT